MDVLLSEEEQMVKNLAREFLEAECPPSLAREMEKDDLGYPPELWRQLAQLGWFGMALPEEYGGQGLPITYLGLVLEEVGRTIAPVPFHSTMVAALTVARDGSAAQKQALLPRVNSGDLVMTWAFNERDPRFIPETINLQAVAEGDDFILTGTKMFVDNFNAAEQCLVVCRTDSASADNLGISLFLVDTKSPGITDTPLTTLAKDKQSRVSFDGVRVPASNLVGTLNEGWPVVESMLERATVLLCAQMVGAARKDAEMAIEYAQEPHRVRASDRLFPIDTAPLRGHDPVGGWRPAPYLRSPMEDGPGTSGGSRGVSGEGILQRKVRGHGPVLTGHPRGHRVHDGVRPTPVVPSCHRMDHEARHELRAPFEDRQGVARPTGARKVGYGPYPGQLTSYS